MQMLVIDMLDRREGKSVEGDERDEERNRVCLGGCEEGGEDRRLCRTSSG